MNNLPQLLRIFIRNWATACYSCGRFYPAAGYELRLSWVQAAGYRLQLSRVLAAGYKLRLTPSDGWLEFQQLDTTYSWPHPTAHSCSHGWIRLKADSILRLTTSCSWFYSASDSSPPARLDLWLTYTLIYQVILKTYSANTSFLCFVFYQLISVTTDPGSGCCFKNLEGAWESLKKLEETSRP